MSENTFNEVSAEDILKVAHWVYVNKGEGAPWKLLQDYAAEVEREEARALRNETVAEIICHSYTRMHLDQVSNASAFHYLELGSAIVAALDELDGEVQA